MKDTQNYDLKKAALLEAIKHVKLAAQLVGHFQTRQLLEEVATEARMSRDQQLKRGGWS